MTYILRRTAYRIRRVLSVTAVIAGTYALGATALGPVQDRETIGAARPYAYIAGAAALASGIRSLRRDAVSGKKGVEAMLSRSYEVGTTTSLSLSSVMLTIIDTNPHQLSLLATGASIAFVAGYTGATLAASVPKPRLKNLIRSSQIDIARLLPRDKKIEIEDNPSSLRHPYGVAIEQVLDEKPSSAQNLDAKLAASITGKVDDNPHRENLFHFAMAPLNLYIPMPGNRLNRVFAASYTRLFNNIVPIFERALQQGENLTEWQFIYARYLEHLQHPNQEDIPYLEKTFGVPFRENLQKRADIIWQEMLTHAESTLPKLALGLSKNSVYVYNSGILKSTFVIKQGDTVKEECATTKALERLVAEHPSFSAPEVYYAHDTSMLIGWEQGRVAAEDSVSDHLSLASYLGYIHHHVTSEKGKKDYMTSLRSRAQQFGTQFINDAVTQLETLYAHLTQTYVFAKDPHRENWLIDERSRNDPSSAPAVDTTPAFDKDSTSNKNSTSDKTPASRRIIALDIEDSGLTLRGLELAKLVEQYSTITSLDDKEKIIHAYCAYGEGHQRECMQDLLYATAFAATGFSMFSVLHNFSTTDRRVHFIDNAIRNLMLLDTAETRDVVPTLHRLKEYC